MIRVTIAPTLIADALSEGSTFARLKVISGLPPGCVLVWVKASPHARSTVGVLGDVELYFATAEEYRTNTHSQLLGWAFIGANVIEMKPQFVVPSAEVLEFDHHA